MSLNSPILNLPRELLDELVSYLDSNSMLRFCRAIPQLNDYANIVSDVAQTLNERLSFIWPNLFIFITNREAFNESHRLLITRLGALITRFNSHTIVRDFEPAEIAQACTMASQSINLTIRIPDVAPLWVEQLRIQRKLVHCLDLQSFPPRIITAVPDLNPEELRCSSKDVLLGDLKACTRLRRLELEVLKGCSNGLVLSKKEWIDEEGFWHRMAVGNGESRQ